MDMQSIFDDERREAGRLRHILSDGAALDRGVVGKRS